MLKKLPFTKLRLFLPFFLLLILTQMTFAQDEGDLTCKDFKLGTFELKDPYGPPTKVIRKGKFQIEEKGENGGKFRINWESDCVYILTPEKGSKFEKIGNIKVTIVEIKENVALTEASMEKFPEVPKYIVKMTKIE